MRRIVVAGASRGLGAAIAQRLAAKSDIIALSRSRSESGQWLACDLADPAQIAGVAARIAGPFDALIVVAGIWEAQAFSPDYRFDASSAAEISRILAVNLQAPILLVQAMLPLMRNGGKIVLIGSTSGLDNIRTPEVGYNASKAGLRGAAQALAQALKPQGIAVSILNPGDIGTPDVLAAKQDGHMRPDGNLPMADVLTALDCLLSLSPEASFCEMNLIGATC